MNQTIRSLVAASAATAALSLITLAAASTSAASSATTATSASSVVPTGNQVLSNSWTGWVDTMNQAGGYNRFNRIEATFKVPGINCGKSVIGTKRYPGGPYSAAAFWVGLDGTNSDSNYLEQAGITATCASKGAFAQYYAWYQMTPKTVKKVPLAGLRVSDSITVVVIDTAGVDPNSPKWADPKYAGYSYSVSIKDTTRKTGYYQNGLKPSNSAGYAGGQAPGTSAEVITEGVSNGPYNTPYATGLADMGTVNYTDVYVDSLDTGWIYGMNMHPNSWWTAAPWSAGHQHYIWFWGQNPQDHNKWEWYKVNTYWQTLMHPGTLGGVAGGSSSPFSTYWK
jgi:hypothetical protein